MKEEKVFKKFNKMLSEGDKIKDENPFRFYCMLEVLDYDMGDTTIYTIEQMPKNKDEKIVLRDQEGMTRKYCLMGFYSKWEEYKDMSKLN